MALKSKDIILGVTGSIAAYKACDIIRRLQDHGYRVSVVMTKEAERFVTPLTLESLSGGKVYRDMFADAESWQMNHIRLAEKSAIFLIAPATANIIGKIANGIADDLLSCLAMTTQAKILIAPAMNTQMYHNKILQSNIKKLQGFGVDFIFPVEGKLACGTTGDGHLADVEDIVKKIRSLK